MSSSSSEWLEVEEGDSMTSALGDLLQLHNEIDHGVLLQLCADTSDDVKIVLRTDLCSTSQEIQCGSQAWKLKPKLTLDCVNQVRNQLSSRNSHTLTHLRLCLRRAAVRLCYQGDAARRGYVRGGSERAGQRVCISATTRPCSNDAGAASASGRGHRWLGEF